MRNLLKLIPLLGALTFFLGVLCLGGALFVHAYGVPSFAGPRPLEPRAAEATATATAPAGNPRNFSPPPA